MRNLRNLALAATASGALYAGMVLLPAAAPALVWVVPLPGLLLAAVRPRETTLWFLLTAAALAIAAGAAGAFAFAATVGIATVLFANGLARSWSVDRTVATALFAWALGVGVLFFLASGTLAEGIAAARDQVDEAFSLAIETSKAAGADVDALALLEAERETLVASVLGILPGLVILTGGAILCANLAVARRIVPLFEEFRLPYWRAPEALIWAFIASGFGMFAPVDATSIVAANLFVVLLGCYFLQGLAIVMYYLDRFGLPMSLRIGTYLLIAIQQLLAAVVLALGIFDLWGNFRRLHSGAADASVGPDGD
jgi:uncharacterized protein YybS (DUF2232 family)